MKASEFLKSDLSSSLLFFIYGVEQYLIDTCAKHVETLISERDLNYARFESSVATNVLIEECEQLPCFSDYRLVKSENLDLFDKGDPAHLIEYLKNPSPYTRILFTYNGTPDKRKSLYKYLSKNATVVDANIAENELRRWLIVTARRNGLTLTPELAELLIQVSGSDMYTLLNELKKLSSVGAQPTKNEILMYASRTTEYSVFLIHDHMMRNEIPEAFNLLSQVKQTEKTLIPLVSLLANKFHLMYTLKCISESGISPDEAILLVKAHPYAAKIALKESRSFSKYTLSRALKLLSNCDYSLKSGGPDSGGEALLISLYGKF